MVVLLRVIFLWLFLAGSGAFLVRYGGTILILLPKRAFPKEYATAYLTVQAEAFAEEDPKKGVRGGVRPHAHPFFGSSSDIG